MELVITLLTTLISLTLAVFVLLKNYKSSTHLYFAALMIYIGAYPLFNYLSLNSKSSEEAFYWAKLILFSAIPVGPFFLFFVKTFPSPQSLVGPRIQLVLLSWATLNLILAHLGLIFSSVEIVNGVPKIEAGPAVISFGLLQVTTIVASAWVLINKYLHSTGFLRLQLKYITLGISLSFGLTLLATLILPLVFNITLLIPISPLFLLIAAVATSYSILKHRLLDIRLVLARTIAYALLVVILSAFYVASVFVVSSLFLDDSVGQTHTLTYAVLALFVAFTFDPLRRLLEKATNRILFKNSYNSNTLLSQLTHVMATTLDLQQLTKQTLQVLLKTTQVSRGAFLLFSESNFYDLVFQGFKSTPRYTLDQINLLFAKNRPLLLDEETDEKVAQLMREMDISLVMPLFVGSATKGLLVLSEKRSGELYTQQDLEVIRIFGPEVAVAINNSQSYEEIKKFNITLTNEVERATKELKEANLKLKELDKVKDDFFSIASHELRTPLTVIRGNSSMILEGYGQSQMTEIDKQMLKDTYDSAVRLIELVNDFLDASRIDQGRLKMNIEKVDLVQLTKKVVEELSSLTKGIYLKYDSALTVGMVNADANRTKQVLINLVGNSIKFTTQGGINVRQFVEAGKIVTSIVDTGTGIPQDRQKLLFDRFQQVMDKKMILSVGGSGLGLYISRKITELMGGTLELVKSEPGKGSEFAFKLPVSN